MVLGEVGLEVGLRWAEVGHMKLRIEDLIKRGFSESAIFGMMIGLSQERYEQAKRNVKRERNGRVNEEN